MLTLVVEKEKSIMVFDFDDMARLENMQAMFEEDGWECHYYHK